MKTNRFEEILRRKLESIQPDFQDQDWDKWQSFNQLHSPPSFWQSYGHWLGYAVATLSTAVMVVLYVNQTTQNDTLMKELNSLKQQVALQPQPATPADSATYGGTESRQAIPAAGKPDTVYIIERRTVYREVPWERTFEQAPSQVEEPRLSQYKQPATPEAEEDQVPESTEELVNNARVAEPNSRNEAAGTLPIPSPLANNREKQMTVRVPDPKKNRPEPTPAIPAVKGTLANPTVSQANESVTVPQPSPAMPQSAQAGISGRIELGELTPLATSREFANSRNYLYRRLQARMPQRARALPSTPSVVAQVESGRRESTRSTPPADVKATNQKATRTKMTESRKMQEKASADQKTEEITKEERLLPKFGLNLPFRIGAGQQWTGKSKAFSLWNEVLLGSNWSIQTGVNWNILEAQKFMTESKFKVDMREDFRKKHAMLLPPSFQIFNITTQTTVLQVPLGINYRGELGHNFTYLIGASTSINIRAKQVLMFDFERPTKDFGQQSVLQYLPIPLLNNAQFSAGLEKRWSPIVMQVGTFVETRAKTFPFLKDRTQVGLRVKLLYEFGSTKKK